MNGPAPVRFGSAYLRLLSVCEPLSMRAVGSGRVARVRLVV
jgi:hypothetical protein